jgi:hypothetical protein
MAFGRLSPTLFGLLGAQPRERGLGYHTSAGGSERREALAIWPCQSEALNHLVTGRTNPVEPGMSRRLRREAAEGGIRELACELVSRFSFARCATAA